MCGKSVDQGARAVFDVSGLGNPTLWDSHMSK